MSISNCQGLSILHDVKLLSVGSSCAENSGMLASGAGSSTEIANEVQRFKMIGVRKDAVWYMTSMELMSCVGNKMGFTKDRMYLGNILGGSASSVRREYGLEDGTFALTAAK